MFKSSVGEKLGKSFAETIKEKAGKIQAIINQMSRHENLNKEDMPFVCEILNGELESIVNQLKAGGEK